HTLSQPNPSTRDQLRPSQCWNASGVLTQTSRPPPAPCVPHPCSLTFPTYQPLASRRAANSPPATQTSFGPVPQRSVTFPAMPSIRSLSSCAPFQWVTAPYPRSPRIQMSFGPLPHICATLVVGETTGHPSRRRKSIWPPDTQTSFPSDQTARSSGTRPSVTGDGSSRQLHPSQCRSSECDCRPVPRVAVAHAERNV